jgi:hypothetical protein
MGWVTEVQLRENQGKGHRKKRYGNRSQTEGSVMDGEGKKMAGKQRRGM